ncbi:heavy metal transporter (plasmid) [Cellulomonas sp. WB94]|uniref:heavy-metal-associated domain-containing protein n=1 Tax=Cellulomonas sp. WB94 TaxID=2173174 RepID=UPI000D57D538|nr:heavy metal transporter [Cellulomonas sp. WB94]
MTVATFVVEGLTCGSCLAEVLEELRALDGVTGVAVDLVKGGLSPVTLTSITVLGAVEVRAAVRRAGFVVAGPDRWALSCTHEPPPQRCSPTWASPRVST